MSKPEEMWQCQFTNCGYIYDPARGDKNDYDNPKMTHLRYL
ncbi:MAG: hypothetical protein FJ126_12105 [Deltaproteobacteria bacterium]|nr:hypothetical protein [Deltaproteobacteria bacterium]